MARLSQLVLESPLAQIEAGAQLVQVFDSWVGALSPSDYRRYVLPHMTGIFTGLQRAGAPSIHFGTGTAGILPLMREAGGDVIGVDWRGGPGGGRRGGGGGRGLPGDPGPPLLRWA